jgi:RNA 3'-terminal phosphate cyclase (ATP)
MSSNVEQEVTHSAGVTLAGAEGTIAIDGSYGEGGGQVLRTSLTLSVLTGRPLEITRIRAGRKKPGLRPQHLTAVRALAASCAGELHGDVINSQRLVFRPGGRPSGGDYLFDVNDAAQGGSAGAVTLIAQAVLLPLAFASGPSRVTLRGGTHVPWSPPFHYLRDVFLPVIGRMGCRAEAHLNGWGWYPVGQGEVELVVQPCRGMTGLQWMERGELAQVTGVAGVTNLPAHIPQRMASRANNLLRGAGITGRVEALRARGAAAGAGIFLTADYASGPAGFSALGRRGLPAEKVAESACASFFEHHQDLPAAVDPWLADQLILPLALAAGESALTTSKITQHTLTNIHIVAQFLGAGIEVEGRGEGGTVRISGIGYHV